MQPGELSQKQTTGYAVGRHDGDPCTVVAVAGWKPSGDASKDWGLSSQLRWYDNKEGRPNIIV